MDYGLMPDRLSSLINHRRLLEAVRVSVEKDLYRHMERPVPLAEISSRTGMELQFSEYLLETLHKCGYLEKSTGADGIALYKNTPESGMYLNSRRPTFIGADVFTDVEIGDLLDRFVSSGPGCMTIDKGHWTQERLKSIASMSLLGSVQYAVSNIDLSGRKNMLDIGGGHGLYSIFFSKQYPDLKCTIIELPQVAELAREFIRHYDTERSVDVISSDYNDAMPEGRYDVVLLSNIVASIEELDNLLAISKKHLVEGGLLVLRNFVCDAVDDCGSSLTVLERYSRRGKKGYSKQQLIDAMRNNGISDVRVTGAFESTVIIQGIYNKE